MSDVIDAAKGKSYLWMSVDAHSTMVYSGSSSTSCGLRIHISEAFLDGNSHFLYIAFNIYE